MDHPSAQSDGIVEQYMKTVEDHLQKVILMHQRYKNERLSFFLLPTGPESTGPQAQWPPD
jgi:hypothetical protein